MKGGEDMGRGFQEKRNSGREENEMPPASTCSPPPTSRMATELMTSVLEYLSTV